MIGIETAVDGATTETGGIGTTLATRHAIGIATVIETLATGGMAATAMDETVATTGETAATTATVAMDVMFAMAGTDEMEETVETATATTAATPGPTGAATDEIETAEMAETAGTGETVAVMVADLQTAAPVYPRNQPVCRRTPRCRLGQTVYPHDRPTRLPPGDETGRRTLVRSPMTAVATGATPTAALATAVPAMVVPVTGVDMAGQAAARPCRRSTCRRSTPPRQRAGPPSPPLGRIRRGASRTSLSLCSFSLLERSQMPLALGLVVETAEVAVRGPGLEEVEVV